MGKEYLLQDSPHDDPYRRSSSNVLDYFIKKVVLSSSPVSVSNDYVAVAILNETEQLVFCKKGIDSWKMIDGAQYYSEDVICYKGLFYAVTKRGSLAICDVTGDSPLITVITPLPLITRTRPRPDNIVYHMLASYGRTPQVLSDHVLYLVDLFGELLLVTRYFEFVMDTIPNISVYKTVGFDVFRFDSTSRIPVWMKVENLGDYMLFLGGNSSLSLLATDFSRCERNCIYFTAFESKANDNGNRQVHDSGVFNLGDGNIKPLPYCDGSSRLFLPPPIWVITNPC